MPDAQPSNQLQRKPAESGPPIFKMLAEQMMPEIKRALPQLGITPERMTRMALTCIRKTDKLLQCDQRSLLAAIIELAQLGLEPSTPLGHAWILPYGRNAQVIIGYKGMIALADRGGVTMNAEVVYEADHFVYPRPGETVIDHVPSPRPDRGARKYAYAYATREGRPMQWKVITEADIARARESSAAVKGNRKDSPWFGDENGKPGDTDAMWRKTAIRRLAPFIPMSAEAQTRMVRALELDQLADEGLNQTFDFTGEDAKTEVKTDDIERRLEQHRNQNGGAPSGS